MDREHVIDIVLNASGWQECQRAKRVLQEWIQAHPNDWGMLDMGESLEMSMEGLEPPFVAASNTHKTAAQKAV